MTTKVSTCATTGVPTNYCTCIKCSPDVRITAVSADRYSDELVDPPDSEGESPYCECAALHSEGTEEMDSGQCSACGGIL
jgi:hypothetical protein